MSTTIPDHALPRELAPSAIAVGDGHAWTLALLPLFMIGLSVACIVLWVPGWQTELVPLNLALYAGLIAADRRALKAAGMTRPPSMWWVILAPGYLWQRATRLRRSRAPFWVMLATSVLPLLAQQTLDPHLLARLSTLAGQLPCDASRADVVDLFNGLPSVKRAGVVAQSIDGVVEVAHTGAQRSCTAVIHGSNGKQYGIDFFNTTVEQGPYIRMSVRSEQ